MFQDCIVKVSADPVCSKLDLLKAKLKARKHPIKRNWPKYDQPSDSPEGVSTFFKQTFRERFKRANRTLQASRTLHVYTTCALDSRSMKVVISASKLSFS